MVICLPLLYHNSGKSIAILKRKNFSCNFQLDYALIIKPTAGRINSCFNRQAFLLQAEVPYGGIGVLFLFIMGDLLSRIFSSLLSGTDKGIYFRFVFHTALAVIAILVCPVYSEAKQVIASWYGTEYHGRQAASGEVYDMYSFSAAHRTLPFGTKLRVKNTRNGKTVMVVVNDRGPFVEGRSIDLSLKAAEKIGIKDKGMGQVTIELVKHIKPDATNKAAYSYIDITDIHESPKKIGARVHAVLLAARNAAGSPLSELERTLSRTGTAGNVATLFAATVEDLNESNMSEDVAQAADSEAGNETVDSESGKETMAADRDAKLMIHSAQVYSEVHSLDAAQENAALFGNTGNKGEGGALQAIGLDTGFGLADVCTDNNDYGYREKSTVEDCRSLYIHPYQRADEGVRVVARLEPGENGFADT